MTSANLLARVRTLLDEVGVSGTGAVLTAVVKGGGGGSGYSVGDKLSLSGGNSNAIVEVMTTSGGSVLTVAVLVQGTGYISATSVPVTGGGGTDCLINILTVATATYFTDTEIYQALTDGQNALCSMALAIYNAKQAVNLSTPIPDILEPLYSVKTGTVASGTSIITLSSNVLDLISLKYNSAAGTPLYSVRMRETSSSSIFEQDNSFLASSGTTYYAKFTGNNLITLETASTNNAAAYSAEVISQPVDIDVGNNPMLPENAVSIIAYFAASKMLSKDQRLEESANAFKTFLQLSQQVVQN